MTRVGNTEQIMVLVRTQLQRMVKQQRADKTRQASRLDSKQLDQRQRIQVLSAIESLSSEVFAEQLTRALLSEEFGPEVSRSPAFQRVVERTANAIQADPQISHLIMQVRQQL